MKLKPLSNNIIFKFCDKTSNGKFINSGSGQIILTAGIGDQTGVHRWGRVVAIGPDVDLNIKVGTFICIEQGKWTTQMIFEKEKFWRTADEFVMMIDDSEHYYEM